MPSSISPSLLYAHDTWKPHFVNGSYFLLEYAPGLRKSALTNQVAGLQSEVLWQLRRVLDAIENHDEYTLRALHLDKAKGLLRIDFSFTRKDAAAEEQVYLDPGHDWRLVERRVETPSLIATNRWTYGLTLGGLEFPTRSTDRTVYKVAEAPPNLDITCRLIRLKLTDKTPSDFRLSAFELPEPIDVRPPERPRIWAWLMAAVLGLAALAALFAWLGNRQAARAQPKAPMPLNRGLS